MDKENAENTNRIGVENIPEDLVFGLDIGTRNIVGTVGYRNSDGRFVVIAQAMVQHATRAMLDGQIHDIGRVADNIEKVRDRLEELTGRKLKNVCIAAAGRVLKTIEEDAEVKFATETVVTSEQVYSLDMLAVEKAHEKLKEMDNSGLRFFCVGYSVMHYYQNDYPISNLEGHKCTNIRTELIATFLPEEVVDGLYAAVERAGLYVENLTLEPIAAINIAIPERFRLLNIALVDVGAGTSDISITKDGSIIAYGMIPYAGDELTENIAKHYLVDFQEADRLKCESTNNEEVTFHDIMGLPQQVTSEEVAEVVSETVHMITKSIADKITELNGGKSVSAVFVVGGGGKMRGFTETLAEYLELQKERVALRGTEVLGEVTFLQQDVEIDSLLVTPVGICLNYYEQRNNFVFVNINGERIKLYDNGKLTILDAALQVGLPNEVLFPQRGDALTYTINGDKRMQRGEHGESAIIRLNDEEAGISTPISQNDTIEVTPSTKGVEGILRVENLPEYKSTISYYLNDKKVVCPCFVSVNDELVSGSYEIQEGDRIQVLDYYTLEQVLEFMDVVVDGVVFVNNEPAGSDTRVYENFKVKCDIPEEKPQERVGAAEPDEQPQEHADAEKPDGQSEDKVPSDAAKPDGKPSKEIIQSDAVRADVEISQNNNMKLESVISQTAAGTPASGNGIYNGQIAVQQTGSNLQNQSPLQSEGVGQPYPAGQSSLPGQNQPTQPRVTTGQAQQLQQGMASGQTQQSQQGVPSDDRRMEPEDMIQRSVPPVTGNSVIQTGVSTTAQNLQTEQGALPESQTLSVNSLLEDTSGKVPPLTPRVQRTSQPIINATNLIVTVNGESVVLKGKANYVLVDILDVYPVDTAVAHGDRMEIKVNGVDCDFSHPIRSGDNVVLRWVED